MKDLPESVRKYMDEGCPLCGGGGCVAETIQIDGAGVTVCSACAFERQSPGADPLLYAALRMAQDEDAASMKRTGQ